MKTSSRLSALILSGSLLALAGLAQADSHMGDAVTKMDEAAEAEAKKAEAAAEAQVDKMKKNAEIEQDAVRGEPMEEAEVGGED